MQQIGVESEKVRDAFKAARMPIPLERLIGRLIGEDATAAVGDLVADVAARPPE